MRDVVYDPRWEADLARLRNGIAPPAPVDEVISSVEWLLGRDAESYPTVAGTRFRVLNTVAARGVPPLNVWFLIEGDERVVCVRLVAVETVEEEDSTNGL